MKSVFLNNIVCWAPGMDTSEKWLDWADNNKNLPLNQNDSPKLEYVDPLFKRRLSQLTKMTIEVLHNLIVKTNCRKNTKIIFITNRGEINQEFKINKMLIQDKVIMPAAFSLSVFNTSIAMATIVNKTTGGYSVIIPAAGNFIDGFNAAVAPVLSGDEEQIILIYGDEYIISEYNGLHSKNDFPLAFAGIVQSKKNTKSEKTNFRQVVKNKFSDPKDFLKNIISIIRFSYSSCEIEVAK